MKFLILLSFVLTLVSASVIPSVPAEDVTVFKYHSRFGVPNADAIKKAEENFTPDSSRIIGGSHAFAGQFPYQVGTLISLTNGWTSVCGASLLTNTRTVSAAHCWYDGENQAFLFQVVFGSTTLFTGGTRINTNNIHMHPSWNPLANTGEFTNDVMIITHNGVAYSNLIQPIALPSGSELNNNFVGVTGVASGYGINSDSQNGVPQNQVLWHVNLNVITNAVCQMFYGSSDVISSTICTSGTIPQSTYVLVIW